MQAFLKGSGGREEAQPRLDHNSREKEKTLVVCVCVCAEFPTCCHLQSYFSKQNYFLFPVFVIPDPFTFVNGLKKGFELKVEASGGATVMVANVISTR